MWMNRKGCICDDSTKASVSLYTGKWPKSLQAHHTGFLESSSGHCSWKLGFHLDRWGSYTSDELDVRLHGMRMSGTEIAATQVDVSGTSKPMNVLTVLNKV